MGKCRPVFKQFFVIACCNLLTLSIGITSGWATINSVELQNENTTFATGPLSVQESSLVISIFNVGGFIGNFAAIPITQAIGMKGTIHFLGIPLITSSLLIIWAKNVFYLYASRLLIGFIAGSLTVAIITLVNDISYDNVRGALNSLYDPSFNLGLIISFFLGNYMSYTDQAKMQLIVPAIFTVILFFLPESPDFLMKKDKEKRAIKSNRFYKGSIAALEMVEFISQKQRNDPSKNEKGQNVDGDGDSNAKLTFKDFCTPHAKAAFFISCISLILSFFSAILIVMSYVTDIFNRTGSSLSEKNSSILISITQIIANLVLLNIVERINRRTLYIGSSILTAIGYFLFAAYALLWRDNPELEWMPPFCLSFIIYFSWLGLVPMPFIITNEIFPKKIRQTCLALVISSMWIILFVLGLIFPVFMDTMGIANCMTILGVFCLLNAGFGLFCIPETRGKSFEEIAELLST